MTDAYDVAASRLARSRTTTLAECVPLLDVALEFIDRGPSELTIEAVEAYREAAIRLLENMRPVIERQAKATLAAWRTQVGDVVEFRAAA
jgi:DNA-binding transcriptional MocR family regulator